MSYPRSGTGLSQRECKAQEVGAGSATPARKDEFISSAKFKKELK
ncbi:TPA: hypothetical protein ACTN4J_001714 [Campylobacter jejuni]